MDIDEQSEDGEIQDDRPSKYGHSDLSNVSSEGENHDSLDIKPPQLHSSGREKGRKDKSKDRSHRKSRKERQNKKDGDKTKSNRRREHDSSRDQRHKDYGKHHRDPREEYAFQHSREHKHRHYYDRHWEQGEVEDLRERLIRDRRERDSSYWEPESKRDRKDDYGKEAIERDKRKERLLQAESEKQKEMSRRELQERRKRRDIERLQEKAAREEEKKVYQKKEERKVKHTASSVTVAKSTVLKRGITGAISDNSDDDMMHHDVKPTNEQLAVVDIDDPSEVEDEPSEPEVDQSDREDDQGSHENKYKEDYEQSSSGSSSQTESGSESESEDQTTSEKSSPVPNENKEKSDEPDEAKMSEVEPDDPESKEIEVKVDLEEDEVKDENCEKEKEDAFVENNSELALPPSSPPEVKVTLPPYYPAIQGCRSVEEFHCLNKIEEGAYGVVYRGRDKKTNEIVALKRLKMENEKEGFPITSLREVNTLLKAQHPNIVTVKEIVVGSNLDKIYIVMEYVEHDLKSLMEIMKEKKTHFLHSEVKTLLIQLLRAVAHLHDNWILHRDLKTSNLLLSHKGILKVGDFGLAREYGSPLKPYTPIVVTLWYRSPELLLGQEQYSIPIDMWSVGCIFGELLLMTALFPGKSEIDQLNKIFKDLGTPNEKIWPGYSSMPALKKLHFADYPYNQLRNRFADYKLTDLGFDLLNRFLTYNPARRITAEEALKHDWLTEKPLPKDPSIFPTWPAKSEQVGHKKHAHSPKAPSGGRQYKQLEGDDEPVLGFQLSGVEIKKPLPPVGGGFSLKF